MELRHLRYFTAVARYLNFSEASRRLHVAQPAVSQTILDLEEEIGTRLFLRSNRNVRLTAAGTALLEEAATILKHADDAKRMAQRAARGEVGRLRIAFIAPATAPLLPGLVQTYRSQYPDVELELRHLNPDDQLAAFDAGALDLGLTRPLPPDRRSVLQEEIVYTDYLSAVFPPGHPAAKEKKIKLERLAAETFVLFHRAGAPGLFDEAVALCRRAGFSPKVRHEPELMTTVFVLVESGLGVSLVPCFARGFLQQKTIHRPLAVQSNPMPLCATWLRGSQSPTLSAFLDVVRAQKPAIQKQVSAYAI
jgi:DNA-binding transcriptional LysR family regulator